MLDLKKINKKYLILFFVVTFLIMWTTSHLLLMNSDAYQKAVVFSENNPLVLDTIGKSLKFRLALVGSKLSERQASGNAELILVVSGEKTNGDIILKMNKDSTGWTVTAGELEIKDRKINLF